MKACKRIVASLTVVALGYGTAAQAASIYNNIVSSYGAVADYHMDETSGTTMIDAIASNNGTYSSGVTLNSAGPQPPAFPGMDPANAAPSFDGTANSHAQIAAVTGLSTTTYSMDVWFNDSSYSSDLKYLIGRGSGASLSYDSVGLDGAELFFFNGVGSATLTTASVSLNVWHDLVLTRNGTTVNIYLDGVDTLTTTASNTFGTSTRIVVGDRPGDVNGLLNPVGFFDEVSLYNTELTQAQVTTLFSTVPEPSAGVLLGAGGLALLKRKRAARAVTI